MRLFVAVDPGAAARTALAQSIASLRVHLDGAGLGHDGAVKWVEARHLHLTLHFLGEIDDRRVPGAVSALAEPLPMTPFEVSLGGWGLFPSRGPVRVLWTGVTGGASALGTLHRLVGERLTRQGLMTQSRPLSPHLTVGRVRAVVDAPLRAAVAAAAPPASHDWRVDQCVLYQSRLAPAGPTYLVQARTLLHP